MKKILFLNQFRVKHSIGGIETFLLGLIKHCKKLGFNVNICYGQTSRSIKVPKTIILPKLILDQITSDADLIHANWWTGAISAFDFSSKRPFITTLHGTSAGIKEALGAGCSLAKRLSLFETAHLEQIACSNSDVIIAVSPSVCDEIKKYYSPKSRILVIQNGVDLRRFFPIRKKVKRDWFVVGLVGRMDSYEKGFCRIMPLIKKYEPNSKMRFIVFGSLNYYQKTQLPFVENRFVQYDKMPLAYREMDVFLNVSRYEGFGLALLEAMASGIVPISSKVGIAKEIIKNGKNGFVLSDLDQNGNEELKELLDWLSSNPEICIEVGLSARKTAEKFDIEKTYSSYVRLYQELLNH